MEGQSPQPAPGVSQVLPLGATCSGESPVLSCEGLTPGPLCSRCPGAFNRAQLSSAARV